jgi:predicted O-methyltransferase YrrM
VSDRGRVPDPAEVDAYLEQLVLQDEPLLAAQAAPAAYGLPEIHVTPLQGAFLAMLAALQGARRALEIGTLAGYSTIWLGRALRGPDAALVSLELDPARAEVARRNVARAGLAEVVEIRVGRALDSLAELSAAGAAPFDLVFIDADKPSNTAYLAAALELTRPGSVIVVDNVVRGGEVADPSSTDPSVVGSREVVEAVAAEPRLVATAVQTVGAKGHDGMIVARVVA